MIFYSATCFYRGSPFYYKYGFIEGDIKVTKNNIPNLVKVIEDDFYNEMIEHGNIKKEEIEKYKIIFTALNSI